MPRFPVRSLAGLFRAALFRDALSPATRGQAARGLATKGQATKGQATKGQATRTLAAMVLAAVAISTAPGPARAQELPELVLAKDLLTPCQDADNDARDGYFAHLECVGFIRGFVSALGVARTEPALCFPEANRDDQLRRAFVRWVHGAFRARSKMPVGDALLGALEDSFGCD